MIKIRYLVSLFAVGLLALGSQAFALSGPLGLHKGMSLRQLQKAAAVDPADRPHWYSSSRVPMGHPMFGRYDFLVDPRLGLCKVVATGKTIHTDARGLALRAAFSDLRDGLASRYGQPSRDFDFARTGAHWPRPADWMGRLFEGDRHLSAFWTRGLGPSSRGLQAIQLEARALSKTSGWIFLVYEFEGADACTKSSDDQMMKGL